MFEDPTHAAGNLAVTPGKRARLIRIADAYGAQLNLAYDSSGRLWRVTDNLGISGRSSSGLRFVYTNADARVDQVRDWSGRTWRYIYDAAGNLTSASNPLLQAMTYT